MDEEPPASGEPTPLENVTPLGSSDVAGVSDFAVADVVAATTEVAAGILASPDPPGRISSLSPSERIAAAQADQADQANELRSRYGYALLALVLLQILLADAIFLGYAGWGVHWKIPEGTLNVWLGATVVQVIGIVIVVVHYLFPNSDNK